MFTLGGKPKSPRYGGCLACFPQCRLSLVSTLQPLALQDAEGLKEEDFRKRRPSPKFSSLKSLETYVMNLQREGVRANVIAAGVLYGQGEAALHGVFKVGVRTPPSLHYYLPLTTAAASIYPCYCY